MWTLAEQAGAVREVASGLRRQSAQLAADEMFNTLKFAEKLEARAAALEYRWFAVLERPESRVDERGR